mgnify:CR=1 FL=1
MKVLFLHLKKKWFDMIQSGEKLEEYREMSEYYISRFMDFSSIVSNCARFVEMAYAATHPEEDKYFKKFDKVVFFLGYPRRNDVNKRIEFDNPRIRIGHGREEWGTDPEDYYFVITWNKK